MLAHLVRQYGPFCSTQRDANETRCVTEFHGLDSDLLQKALNVLVRRGKAQIFGQEDSLGVKFF